MGRTGFPSKERSPLFFSPTLSRRAVDGPDGVALGAARRNLRHTSLERSGVRSVDFSRSEITFNRSTRKIPRTDVAARWRGHLFFRARRIDGHVQGEGGKPGKG